MIDLIFETFHNPKDFVPESGFHDGGSLRVIEMMLGCDVGAG